MINKKTTPKSFDNLTALLSQVDLSAELRRLIEQEIDQINQQISELKSQSLTDRLTELPNRLAFDEKFNSEWNRAIRSQQPLALIAIDIDNFKKYNDTYGHERGDACLQEVADTLRQIVQRSSDLACRLGGEEFFVVVPDATAQEAARLADRIR